jgi:hypothetical protein
MLNKIIAIDYDDTISLNIDAWKQVINLFSSLGAIVYVVTYRESTRFDDMELDIPNVKDYIFTNANGKRKYCEEVVGVEVDIWIDDSPESVVFDYKDLVKNMKIK